MSWTLRLLLEQSEHTLSDFVTLTYASEHNQTVLERRHFELFMKRLRKSIRRPVRFFCCGEYGGKTNRPHWHVLLFGVRLRKRGLSHIAQWPYGHVFAGEIEKASAQYVCRYTLKSQENGKVFDVSMSRRPGIGMNRLREIARGIASKTPDLSYFPPVMSFRGNSYWLDRHAYEACVDEFLHAGGALSYDKAPNNSWLDSDVRALPLETAAREYLNKVNKGAWIGDQSKAQGTETASEFIV